MLLPYPFWTLITPMYLLGFSGLLQILSGRHLVLKRVNCQLDWWVRISEKKAKEAEDEPAESQVSRASETADECRALIINSTSLYASVSALMWRLFTTEEIMAHSVSGKASNSKMVAKPKFDHVKLELLKTLVLEIHKEATSSQITTKIQAVQKAVKGRTLQHQPVTFQNENVA